MLVSVGFYFWSILRQAWIGSYSEMEEFFERVGAGRETTGMVGCKLRCGADLRLHIAARRCCANFCRFESIHG